MNLCVSSIYKLFFGAAIFLFVTKAISQSNQNPLSKFLVESITIEGNKKTKPKIILREVTLKEGDSLTGAELKIKCLRAQYNLMNTSLFVHDTVSCYLDTITKKASINIRLQERWYLWPGLIFEVQDRNFNSWWQTKDLFRINYGVSLTVYNLFGLNQTLTMIFRRGYTEQYGASYRIPYINKKQTVGLNASFNYFRNNEVWYSTVDNELKFHRNYKTYIRQDREAKIGITHRHNLYIRQSLETFYKKSGVEDTIVKLNPNYYGVQQKTIDYFSLQYRFTYDYRDYKPYPLKGYMLDAIIIKDGIGVLSNETTNNLSFYGSAKGYTKLFKRTYFTGALKGRYMPVYKPMYYFNRALGFNELVRGYEYYVVDGQSFAVAKANVRFQVIKPRVIHAPIKSFKKFNHMMYALYVGPFADAGFVHDDYFGTLNPLANQYLLGAGIGIDLIAYYDLVFRVEFSVNRLQQTGIFLHLNAPL